MAINPPPIVVLVAPQMGENIGMCARAMLNCGLTCLRLVNPRDGWPNEAAHATAADADEVIEQATVYPTLDEAIADCHHVVATSARSRSLSTPVWDSDRATTEIAQWSHHGGKVAVLFGPEASGLDNEALSRAGALMKFDTNPEFSSLNLAQSVLLFGWEWKRKAQSADHPAPKETATQGEVTGFLDRLESALDDGDFFATTDQKPHTMQLIRTFFSKANPTTQETKVLHGILTDLKKEKT